MIYLDNGATTKVDSKVLDAMKRAPFGNASSIHSAGREASKSLEQSRKVIADSIGANPKEIIFTSGGTESNNLAIKGVALNKKKGHIIVSKIEHDCILNTAKWLETKGFEITYLDVDSEGFVLKETLEAAIKENTILVSIIHGNNEIGTIQNLEELYNVCKKNNVLFHSDACQSYTKVPLNVSNFDLLTLNSHKIHGPKGIGALYVKSGIKLDVLTHGGGQEFDLRSGTQDVISAVGFSEAVEIANKKDFEQMTKLRDYFIAELLQISGTTLNGAIGNNRLCNNVNVSFSGIEGEAILFGLDHEGICASTGSACSSKSLDASHVMMSITKDHERSHSSIRFTLSKFTTKEELDYTLEKLKEIVKRLRAMSPLVEV